MLVACGSEIRLRRNRADVEDEMGAHEAGKAVEVSVSVLDDFDELTVRQRDWGRGRGGPGGCGGCENGCQGEMK